MANRPKFLGRNLFMLIRPKPSTKAPRQQAPPRAVRAVKEPQEQAGAAFRAKTGFFRPRKRLDGAAVLAYNTPVLSAG